MSKYTTGEIARLCGVSVRTVQYYDTRGVLIPDTLSEGGRRLYSEADLAKMKIICFLRELDLSLDTIAHLMREENSEEVVSLILEEQARALQAEIAEKEVKLGKLRELRQNLKRANGFSVESIGDIAHYMENKKKMRRLHLTLILTGIPVTLLEWGAVILWIATGIWWPFAVYTAVAIPYGILISRYYFSRVIYICPCCHAVFKPKMKEAFWAGHTPTTRKLTCPDCGKKSYCVETYREEA